MRSQLSVPAEQLALGSPLFLHTPGPIPITQAAHPGRELDGWYFLQMQWLKLWLLNDSHSANIGAINN